MYIPFPTKVYCKRVDWLNVTGTVAKTNIFESVQLDLPPPPSVLCILVKMLKMMDDPLLISYKFSIRSYSACFTKLKCLSYY